MHHHLLTNRNRREQGQSFVLLLHRVWYNCEISTTFCALLLIHGVFRDRQKDSWSLWNMSKLYSNEDVMTMEQIVFKNYVPYYLSTRSTRYIGGSSSRAARNFIGVGIIFPPRENLCEIDVWRSHLIRDDLAWSSQGHGYSTENQR